MRLTRIPHELNRVLEPKCNSKFFCINHTTSCHSILKKAMTFPSNEFGSKKLHLYV